MAELIVVDEILIAEGEAEDALADQPRHAVLDPIRRAVVVEAGGEPLDEPDGPVGGAEQQRAGIRRDRAAIERRHHGAAFDGCKTERLRATLCRHRGPPADRFKLLRHNNSRRFGAPMHLPR